MNLGFSRNKLALAVAAAIGSGTIVATPLVADADRLGTYVSGDFHNHETCEDGSISVQKLVNKSMETPWGLDWFVQSGHGGNGNRNCTLAEDASLATPAYPLEYASDGKTVLGPNTTWQSSNPAIAPAGDVSGTAPNQNMWKWQITQ